MTKKTINYYILRFSGVSVFLLLWEIAPRLQWIDSQFVPPLTKVLYAIHKLWMYDDLFTHITVSLWRAMMGLLVATVIGLPIGILFGSRYKSLAKIFNPFFRLLGQVNPFSLIPVFILFFGIGEKAKVAIVAWVCLWPIIYHTMSGIKNVDFVLIKTAKSLNISKWSMLWKLLLPGAAPEIFIGLRISVEMSFFMLIAGEMIGATAGLGWLYHNAAMLFAIDRLYAAGICIVLLAITMNRSLLYIQNGLFFWKEYSGIFKQVSKIKEERKRFTKVNLVFITAALIVVIAVCSKQVYMANSKDYNSPSMQHHKMDNEKMQIIPKGN